MIVNIPDAEGRLRGYSLERLPLAVGELWAARLQKTSVIALPWRRVSLTPFGWRCECPSATVGDAKKGGYHCKHILRCAELAREEGVVSEQEVKAKPEKPAQEKKAKSAPAVYRAIAAVQTALAREGIAKDKQGHNFKFRGIDDVYNALAPLLGANGLVILPRIIDRQQVERQAQKGGALFYTTVTVEYDFVAVEDGSLHTVRTVGEAMDSGDKSSNKALSAAYKYACFQAFCIPTEGDPDADAQSHEVAPQQKPPLRQPAPPQAASSQDIQPIAPAFLSAAHKKAVAYEAVLVAKGVCRQGELIEHMVERAGPAELWTEATAPKLKAAIEEFQAAAAAA